MKLSMNENYINCEKFRLNIKMILALSFVPADKVLFKNEKLKKYFKKKNLKKELIILNWFKINFLESTTPNHKVIFWNVYQRSIDGQPRTTNSLEGLHRHYNKQT